LLGLGQLAELFELLLQLRRWAALAAATSGLRVALTYTQANLCLDSRKYILLIVFPVVV